MDKNPQLTFVLTLEEANMVLAALQELPAKIANPLSQNIREQATKQLQPTEPVAE